MSQAEWREAACETILVVDDDPSGLMLTGAMLRRQGYRVVAVDSGAAAIGRATSGPPPDLVLLDIEMPVMDGFDVVRQLRAKSATADIPVMFLTGVDDTAAEARGLALGAVDYITKSARPATLLAHVRARLKAARILARLRRHNTRLRRAASKLIGATDRAEAAAVGLLISMVKTRDHHTGAHLLRTQAYVKLLATDLQTQPRHAAVLNDAYINRLVRAAPLHDIGKVGIPDGVLNKPGKLDADELAIMRTHCIVGARAIEQASPAGGAQSEVLRIAAQMARWHHERWDGTGYPDKLKGEAIPLSARIMAVADVFDALVSRRPYKEPMSCMQAGELIRRGSGSQFDPAIVGAFERQFDAMSTIADLCNAAPDMSITDRRITA